MSAVENACFIRIIDFLFTSVYINSARSMYTAALFTRHGCASTSFTPGAAEIDPSPTATSTSAKPPGRTAPSRSSRWS